VTIETLTSLGRLGTALGDPAALASLGRMIDQRSTMPAAAAARAQSAARAVRTTRGGASPATASRARHRSD